LPPNPVLVLAASARRVAFGLAQPVLAQWTAVKSMLPVTTAYQAYSGQSEGKLNLPPLSLMAQPMVDLEMVDLAVVDLESPTSRWVLWLDWESLARNCQWLKRA
jgi:hypothetical protein